MWLMLNDSFLSIVHKECGRGELLVRARRPGDIETVFGRRVKTRRSTDTDYAYRAVVSKEDVKAALAQEVDRIVYSNFKDSIPKDEQRLHDAYLSVWATMLRLQPTRPYSGHLPFFGDLDAPVPPPPAPAKKPSKAPPVGKKK